MLKLAYTGIETYEGLKGLRAERAMYLGNTGLTSDRHAPRALNQTLQEIVSNSIDEFVAGHGDQISITIHRDNSITIQDHGRGMPKGPEDSFDDVIRAATVPHSSGKFSGSGYEASGIAGMHGIGLKATNAVSKYLTIEAICHSVALNENGEKELTGDLEHYRVHFENGGDLIESTLIKRYNKPKHVEGNHFTCRGEDIYTGTKISYLPDDGPVSEDDQQPVFESIQWVAKDLYERFQSSSFLNAGLQISFTDERFEDDQGNYTIKEWNYPEGLSDYIRELSQGQNLLKNVKTPIFIQSDCEEKEYQFYLQLALMMTDDIDCDIKSYANGVPTKEGGPHVDGFQVGLTKAINDYVQLKGHKKLKKNETISQSDVLQGWIGAFEIRIPGEIASFEGQTKEKLGTAQAKNATYKIVYEHVSNWLHDHESEANAIIEVMIEAKSSREAAIKARQDAKKARQSKNAGGKLIVSSKLKPASGKDPKKNELFIVEGDSASNIKRDTKTQAIMPLRGKIKNVHDVSLGETLKNEEISTITKVLGTGIGPAFDIKDLQYDKIIIASDKDPDGAAIYTLVLTLFLKYFRPLLEEGHVYLAIPPLYRATKYIKGKPHHLQFYSEQEMSAQRSKLMKDGYQIKRFKGLGEMNPEDVGDCIANPETRVLQKVSISDVQETLELFKILMGNDSKLRKDWIGENVDFDALYEATL